RGAGAEDVRGGVVAGGLLRLPQQQMEPQPRGRPGRLPDARDQRLHRQQPGGAGLRGVPDGGGRGLRARRTRLGAHADPRPGPLPARGSSAASCAPRRRPRLSGRTQPPAPAPRSTCTTPSRTRCPRRRCSAWTAPTCASSAPCTSCCTSRARSTA
ncbi:unnamed protein product, partial [Heterosigma akashiwo]